jgi:WD40 repeat protein
MRGHTNSVTAVSVSGDGRLALSGSFDHTVRLWDLQSGKCLALGWTDSPVLHLAFVSTQAVVGCADDKIGLWEWEAGPGNNLVSQ